MQWGVKTPHCKMQRGDLTPAAKCIHKIDLTLPCIMQQGVNLQFKELHEIEIKLDKI